MTSPQEWMYTRVAGISPTSDNTTSFVTSKTAAQNTSAFPYAKDVGVPSIAGIELLARASGLEIKPISTYRPGAKGFHGTQNAVDFGGSPMLRRTLAAYLYQFSAYLLELIYTDPGVPGGGYYVKNGHRVPQSRYSAPDIDFPQVNIIDNHRDHVHVATTMSGLRAMSANREEIAKQALEEASRQTPPPAGQSSNLLTGEPKSPEQLAFEAQQRRGCAARSAGVAAAVIGVVSSVPIGVLVLFT